MLRLVSRSTPPRCFNNTSNPSATTLTTTMRSWTPGDPIRFQETMQDTRTIGDWTPGQKIRFAGEEYHDPKEVEEERARGKMVEGRDATIEPRQSSLARSSRRPSPTITRATFNSSPHSSFELSGNTSWESSNRWEPPSSRSSESRTSIIGDTSSSSTAVFSYSRSYARVSIRQEKEEVEEDVKLDNLVAQSDSEVKRVDVAVQTESSPVTQSSLKSTISKAELDDLVAGIDWLEDETSFELEESQSIVIDPSTSTPPRLGTTTQMHRLTQPEVENLLEGIDFSQDLELSDLEEEAEEDSFHSAVAHSPLVNNSSPPRSQSSSLHSPRSSSPRIIFKSPRSKAIPAPSPPPSIPSRPDVFTLLSTPPPPSLPSRRSPSLQRSTKHPHSFPRSTSSSPLILSSSSSSPISNSPFPPHSHARATHSTATTADHRHQIRIEIESDEDDSLIIVDDEPVLLKKGGKGKGKEKSSENWKDSIIESIQEQEENSSMIINCEDYDDDSVEIIQFEPITRTNKVEKEKGVGKGKGREREKDKENQVPLSNSSLNVSSKPGYFVRPASLKPAVNNSSSLHSLKKTPTTSISSSSTLQRQNRSLLQGRQQQQQEPLTTTTSYYHNYYRKPKEPSRESFKGRNAEDHYKSALKQYNLQLKWPIHFDYTTWGLRRGGGGGGTGEVDGGNDQMLLKKKKKKFPPKVVFTTDEKIVDETLSKLSGPTGMDLEWDMFDKKTRGQGKTALVQICDQDTILLVQTAKMKNFPESLKAFIEDPQKIKLGVQIAGDARKLERDFGFSPQGLLELNDLTKKFDPQRHVGRTGPLIGLQELVGIYLERYLPKDRTVRCGVWSGVLTQDQKNYGANDVYSSLQVLLALESLINSVTDTPINLFDFTTPKTTLDPVLSSSARSLTSQRQQQQLEKTKRIAPPTPLTNLSSLPPRKLQAYTLFQIDKLSLHETTLKMSSTNAIKQTSVLWSLLGIYKSSLEKSSEEEVVVVEWDEKRLVEAVDELGSAWGGRMKDEHGDLVEQLRKKINSKNSK